MSTYFLIHFDERRFGCPIDCYLKDQVSPMCISVERNLIVLVVSCLWFFLVNSGGDYFPKEIKYIQKKEVILLQKINKREPVYFCSPPDIL